MMRSAHWRRMALPILCLIVSACDKRDARASAADPNAPAVVKAPPVVLPSDTEKKIDTTHNVPMLLAKSTIARNYAILGMAISRADRQMIALQYSTDAKLTTPGGTFIGANAIVQSYSGLTGLKTFVRQSLVTKIVDSTVADSGMYAIVIKRAGSADSTVQRGNYSALWRVRAEPEEWVMSSDHLYPVQAKPKSK
jgi:hypothetical protein